MGARRKMTHKNETPLEFSEEDKAGFRKNFNLFDKKRTGSIPLSDMGTVLRSLGQNPTEAELQALMDEVDADKSGTIDFEEFVNMMSRTNKSNEQMEDEIKTAFLTFDADGSGFITKDELIETLTTMGDPVDEETITGMIQEADLDGDGKINYEEFTKIMLASE